MLNDNTNLDVESTDHEQPIQSELDPLIQPDVKVPSKQEIHVARAQFLTLCWTMFVMGWTNSSTGPLLPRIQIFYDVSCNLYVIPKAGTIFQTSLFFQVGIGAASWIFVLLRTVSDVYGVLMILECCGDLAYIYDIQGIIIGALLNIPMSDRLGLGWVSF